MVGCSLEKIKRKVIYVNKCVMLHYFVFFLSYLECIVHNYHVIIILLFYYIN